MNREPVTLVTIIQVIISLAIAFGLKLTAEQTAALMAIGSVVGALIARNFTWSSASVEKVTNASITDNLKILSSKRG